MISILPCFAGYPFTGKSSVVKPEEKSEVNPLDFLPKALAAKKGHSIVPFSFGLHR